MVRPVSFVALLPCLALILALAATPVRADNFLCGSKPVQPTVPSDLDNVEGDMSIQHIAEQPAGIITCAMGYLIEKCGDHETANKVFDKCIAAGYAGAMIWKGLLLEEGKGVPQDSAKAAAMFRRAAESGNGDYATLGKLHYATALHQGRGVPQDQEAALRWFKEAAAEGSQEARDFLATGYHTGERDMNGIGAGTPPPSAYAPINGDNASLPATWREPPAAATVQARSLGQHADTLAEPAKAPPPQAAAEVQLAPRVETVTGQRLDRVEQPPPEHGSTNQSLLLLLMLALAFSVGLLRQAERGYAIPAYNPARA
ncbi:MAG TPA: tetratricopeptide repeat protein [Rhodocyclaceae bacterium]